MHVAEDFWEEAIAGHGKPDAGLADLENEQGRDHAHQCADQDDEAQSGDVEFSESVDDGSGVIDQGIPANNAGEDDHDADIEDGANDERGDDAAREIALRVGAFFRGGGDGVEADVGEKDDGAAGEDAGPAVGRERMPIGTCE